MFITHLFRFALLASIGLAVTLQAAVPTLAPGITRVPVVFSGGHDTEGVDRGRPVRLIAAALGVPEAVFREAFSHVHPAGPGSGGPTGEEARANKEALMSRLGPHGITNERLDEASNYYRYPPGRGGLWKVQPAVANALVKNGVVVGFEVVEGGAGYTTPPEVTVPGAKGGEGAKVMLSFGKELKTNGAVTGISLPRK